MTLQELLVKIGVDLSGMQEGLSSATSQFGSFASKVEAIGSTITSALAVPLAGIGVAAFKAASDFDEAFDKIRVATGEIGKSLDGLTDSFQKVFADGVSSTKDVATAIGDLNTRLGLSGEPLEKLSAQFLELSHITGENLQGSIRATTQAFNRWNVAVEDQSKTLDYLFNIAQKTGITVTALSTSLSQFAAPMQALGFSLQDAAAMLGKFEKEGVDAGSVIAGLKKELLTLGKAGKDGAKEFDAIVAAIKGAKTEAEAFSIASKVFGKSGVEMVSAIRSGRLEFRGLAQDAKATGVSIRETAKDIEDAPEKFKRLANQLMTALKPLGDVLFQGLSHLADSIKPAVDWIAQLLAGFKNLSPVAQDAVVAIGGVVIALGGLKAAMKLLGAFDLATGLNFSGVFEKLAMSVRAAGAAVAAQAVSIIASIKNIKFALGSDLVGALTGAEGAMARLIQTMSTPIAAGPITLVIAGLLAQLNEIRKTMPEFISSMGAWWDDFGNLAKSAFKDVAGWAKKVFEDIGAYANGAFVAIRGWVANLIPPGVVDAAKTAIGAVLSPFNDLMNAFKSLGVPEWPGKFASALWGLTGPLGQVVAMMKDVVGLSAQARSNEATMTGGAKNLTQSLNYNTLNSPEYKNPTSPEALQAQLELSKKQLANLAKQTGSGNPWGGLEDAAKKAAEAIQKAFSTLGLEDVDLKLGQVQEAFELLGKKGELSGYQIAKAFDALQKAEENASKIALDFRFEQAGVKQTAELEASVRKLKAAFNELFAAYQQGGKGAPSLVDLFQVTKKLEEAQKALNDRLEDFGGKMLVESASHALELSQAYGEMGDAARKAAEALTEIIAALPVSDDRIKGLIDIAALQSGAAAVLDLADAYKQLGIRSKLELDSFASDAVTDFNMISAAAGASSAQAAESYLKMVDALAAANKSLSADTVSTYVKIQDNLKTTSQKMLEFGQAIGNEFRRAFQGLEEAFAKNIIEWNSWKDSVLSVGKQLAEGLLMTFTSALFKPLETQIAGAAAGLAAKLGSSLGLFSSGAGAAASSAVDLGGYFSAATGVGAGAAKTGTSAASGAAGAASSASGLTSALNIANLGVSVLSGIVSGIQGARTNNLLGEIEVTTRKTEAELENLRRDSWDRETHLMVKLDSIWNSLVESLSNIFNRLGDIWSELQNDLQGGIAGLGTTLQNLSDVLTSITIAEDLNGTTAAAKAIQDGFSAIVDSVKDAAQRIVNAIKGVEDAVTKPAEVVPSEPTPTETTPGSTTTEGNGLPSFPDAINFTSTVDNTQGQLFASVVEAIKELGALVVSQFDRLIAAMGSLGTGTLTPQGPNPKTQAALDQIAKAQAILNDLISKGGSAAEVRAMAETLGVSFKYLEDGSVQILDASASLSAAAASVQSATEGMQSAAESISNSLTGFADVALPAIQAAADGTIQAVAPALAGFRDLGEILHASLVQPVSDSGAGVFSGFGPANIASPSDILRDYEGLFGPVNAGFMREVQVGTSTIQIGTMNVGRVVDGREVSNAFLQHLRDHGVEVR